MLGPPDTALLHVCGPPRPGVANRPSSGACCVGLGQGQRGAHRRGSRGQRRVTYQRTRLIKPRPASHGTAAAMRARIAGPSITHSSNKAWRTGDFGPSNVALLVGQWVLPGRQNSVRRGRKPREKSKIDQTLRSGSFEFDLCQKSRDWSHKRTISIPASPGGDRINFPRFLEGMTFPVETVIPATIRKAAQGGEFGSVVNYSVKFLPGVGFDMLFVVSVLLFALREAFKL